MLKESQYFESKFNLSEQKVFDLENDKVREKNKKLEDEIKEMKTKYMDAMKDASVQHQGIRDKEDELKDMKQKLKDTKKENTRLRRIKDKRYDLEREIQDLKQSLKDAKDMHKSGIKTWQDKYNNVLSQNNVSDIVMRNSNNVQNNNTQLHRDIRNLNKVVKNKDKDINKLKIEKAQEKRRLETIAKDAVLQKQRYEYQNQKLVKENADLIQENKRLDDLSKSFTKDVKDRDELLKLLKIDLNNYKEDIRKLEDKLKAKDKELQESKSDEQSAGELFQREIEQSLKYKEAISKMSQEILKLRQENADIRAQYTTQIQTIKRAIDKNKANIGLDIDVPNTMEEKLYKDPLGNKSTVNEYRLSTLRKSKRRSRIPETNLERIVNEQRDQIGDLNDQLKTSQTDLNRATNSLQECADELESTEQRLKLCKSQLKKCRESLAKSDIERDREREQKLDTIEEETTAETETASTPSRFKKEESKEQEQEEQDIQMTSKTTPTKVTPTSIATSQATTITAPPSSTKKQLIKDFSALETETPPLKVRTKRGTKRSVSQLSVTPETTPLKLKKTFKEPRVGPPPQRKKHRIPIKGYSEYFRDLTRKRDITPQDRTLVQNMRDEMRQQIEQDQENRRKAIQDAKGRISSTPKSERRARQKLFGIIKTQEELINNTKKSWMNDQQVIESILREPTPELKPLPKFKPITPSPSKIKPPITPEQDVISEEEKEETVPTSTLLSEELARRLELEEQGIQSSEKRRKKTKKKKSKPTSYIPSPTSKEKQKLRFITHKRPSRKKLTPEESSEATTETAPRTRSTSSTYTQLTLPEEETEEQGLSFQPEQIEFESGSETETETETGRGKGGRTLRYKIIGLY